MQKPKIITLCGSSRHPDAHMAVMMAETLGGRIVIPMGLYGHADVPAGAKLVTENASEDNKLKIMLDELHKRKIDLSDEIVVVMVDNYIGNSTRGEIDYATDTDKKIRYMNFPSRTS